MVGDFWLLSTGGLLETVAVESAVFTGVGGLTDSSEYRWGVAPTDANLVFAAGLLTVDDAAERSVDSVEVCDFAVDGDDTNVFRSSPRRTPERDWSF